MKRWLLGLLALLCMVSMVACSKSAPSLEGEWQAQDALKKDYTIVFKKDKVKIGEQVAGDAADLSAHRIEQMADIWPLMGSFSSFGCRKRATSLDLVGKNTV